MRRAYHVLSAAVFGLALSISIGNTTRADPFIQTNLVSDVPGLATITDPLLVNPWGLSHSPTSPFWTSNQGTNTATLYAVTGSTNVSKVNINPSPPNPPPGGFVAIPTTSVGPQGPTGQVNNTNTASLLLTPCVPTTSSRFFSSSIIGTNSSSEP